MKYLKLLIEHLKNIEVLKNPTIISSFEKIDRKDFVPEDLKDLAYEDIPLSIGKNQTISQPLTVAFMLELLNPQKGNKVLDVGSGSGYTTALLANTVGENGRVIGLEIIQELVNFGKRNLSKYNLLNANIYKVKDELGMPYEAPFDRILVSASASEIPDELVKQLKTGGIMVIPVGKDIYKIEKDGFKIKTKKYHGFVFVPLVENKKDSQEKQTPFKFNLNRRLTNDN